MSDKENMPHIGFMNEGDKVWFIDCDAFLVFCDKVKLIIEDLKTQGPGGFNQLLVMMSDDPKLLIARKDTNDAHA